MQEFNATILMNTTETKPSKIYQRYLMIQLFA